MTSLTPEQEENLQQAAHEYLRAIRERDFSRADEWKRYGNRIDRQRFSHTLNTIRS
jgi:hypothetical protein